MIYSFIFCPVTVCASIDVVCVRERIPFFITLSYIYFTRSFDALVISLLCTQTEKVQYKYEHWSDAWVCVSASFHLFATHYSISDFDGFYSLNESNFFPFSNSLPFLMFLFNKNAFHSLCYHSNIYLLCFHEEPVRDREWENRFFIPTHTHTPIMSSKGQVFCCHFVSHLHKCTCEWIWCSFLIARVHVHIFAWRFAAESMLC